MDATWVPVLGSITSGLVALGGVALANHLTLKRETRKAEEERKKEAAFLAILVSAHLDRYASGCWHVSFDDGTDEYGQPAGDRDEHEATVTPPSFDPLALEVNWKSLPPDLMYRILDIPYRAEQMDMQVRGALHEDDFPDFTDYFDARRREYARLGREVAATAKALRKQAGLPARREGGLDLDAEANLRDRIDAIEAEIGERNRQRAANIARRAAEKAAAQALPAQIASNGTVALVSGPDGL